MMLLLAEVDYDPSLIAVAFSTLSLCLLLVSSLLDFNSTRDELREIGI